VRCGGDAGAEALVIDSSPGSAGRRRILFVCLGNICRSPTAEGVMRALVRDAGLEDRIELDSAGTGAWHIGEPPDSRATLVAHGRGIALEGAARQVERSDFEEFDVIVAMDASNLADLRAIAPDERARAKLVLLRELDPPADGRLDVPDPYHGGTRGFEDVFDLVYAACAKLLAQVQATLPASGRASVAHEGAGEPAGEQG
jgi:protein-tyrosine phosphatase